MNALGDLENLIKYTSRNEITIYRILQYVSYICNNNYLKCNIYLQNK